MPLDAVAKPCSRCDIQDDRHVHKAAPYPQIADVTDLTHLALSDCKITSKRVVSHSKRVGRVGRFRLFLRRLCTKPMRFHQPGHPFVVHQKALVFELSGHSRAAIVPLVAMAVYVVHRFHQGLITLGPLGLGRPTLVVTTAGKTKCRAHAPHRVLKAVFTKACFTAALSQRAGWLLLKFLSPLQAVPHVASRPESDVTLLS